MTQNGSPGGRLVRAERRADGLTLVTDSPPAAPAGGLEGELVTRREWRAAQGVLAQLSGATPDGAGQVLLGFGARWGLTGTTAVARFFLACVAAREHDRDTAALLHRIVAAAAAHDNVDPPGWALPVLVEREPVRLPGEARGLRGGRGVVVVGDLDVFLAPLLGRALAETGAAPAGGGVFVLDLRDLTFCDDAGVAALVAVHTAAHGVPGARVSVIPPRRLRPRRVLHQAVDTGRLPPVFIQAGGEREPGNAGTPDTAGTHPGVGLAPLSSGAAADPPPPPPQALQRPPSALAGGVAVTGALIVLALPSGTDQELAAGITGYLHRVAAAGRPKVVVLDLRWTLTPTSARWWLDQLVGCPLPAGSRWVAVNSPQALTDPPGGVVVLARGADAAAAVRRAYRLVLRACPV